MIYTRIKLNTLAPYRDLDIAIKLKAVYRVMRLNAIILHTKREKREEGKK
jgi:hypothetical protein